MEFIITWQFSTQWINIAEEALFANSIVFPNIKAYNTHKATPHERNIHMPLPMVHLSVAHKLINAGLQIKDQPQFYLGSISPDAIHMRANIVPAEKSATHLIPDGQTRGSMWNNTSGDDYVKLVFDFIEANKPNTNLDFLLGYAVHNLTDMYWTNNIYYQFATDYETSAAPIENLQKAYYIDTDIVDYVLYTTSPWQPDIWQLLQTATSSNFLNLLSASEIKLWNERTLNWYTKPENQYKFEGTPKYITQQDTENFISQCVETIMIGMINQ